jgi:hypothetical protein
MRNLLAALAVALFLMPGCAADEKRSSPQSSKDVAAEAPQSVPLFPDRGEPKGWVVRAWNDVSQPAPEGAKWVVDEDGVLHGSEPRGTWLVSDKEYGDFVLEFEFKLGERGNSGCGIRFPPKGDPAFDGIEIQMADARYNDNKDTPNHLTGALYRAVTPRKQVYRPTEWNHYVITARGNRIKVELNGELIQDVNLDEQKETITRHDGTPAPPLKDRPRRGHIGFQELSRGGAHVTIRDAKITELKDSPKPR